ncbi:11741_t:CDS:2, partial [Scutellospora calospora]
YIGSCPSKFLIMSSNVNTVEETISPTNPISIKKSENTIDLLEEKDAGCKPDKKHFKCLPCDNTRSGGFSPDHGIMLCQNRFTSKRHIEDTMVHEMIHLYDHCRFKVDWNSCYHHACSEVRAAALSGDCKWTREIKRGFFNFTKQHQACVKRRAILSVQKNASCSAPGVAERVVTEVFESCFNDTRPFDEIY